MGYTDDWERVMNGAFGPGGKVHFGGNSSGSGSAAGEGAGSTAGSTPAPGTAAGSAASAMDSMTAALQAQQKALNEALQAQTAAIQGTDAATQRALEESRQVIKDMEADGLLAPGTSEVEPAQRGSFTGLAAKLKESVLGQDAYVDALVRAFRRPFVQGTEGKRARNVILISGKKGTGRHFTLTCIANELAARGLLKSADIAVMDLSLYGDTGSEKLFLQDLYAALHAAGEILLFENYESCHASFLRVLSDLAVKGSSPLTTRYLVRDGYLVDAGTALVQNAVASIDPCGKYFVFVSEKGRDKIADKFGASMVDAIGDVCTTGTFSAESLQTLAAQGLNRLAQKASERLQLTLTADAAVRDWIAAQYAPASGVSALNDACDRLFRALSEYCLNSETPEASAVALTIQNDVPYYSADGREALPLLDLLPAAYTGELEAVQKELADIVGLTALKQYVLDVADNVRVQQRRAAAGMKTTRPSMHMIFTGNPGTGKTTIARVLSRYLKAIGALRGGQLIEVTRADLVGRYSGHTAPLTKSVIESALGGVLFIDEAYSLYRGEQDSFGLEAIDTLVKGIEDHRDDLVVILAGYTVEMAEFLESNSGLASRFPNRVEFPDYTPQELLDITKIQARSKGYTIDAGAEPALLAYYTVQQATNAAKAGNGRLARNTIEKAILNQSRRLVAEPNADMNLVTRLDFELGEEADAAAAADAAYLAGAAGQTEATEPAGPVEPADPAADAGQGAQA